MSERKWMCEGNIYDCVFFCSYCSCSCFTLSMEFHLENKFSESFEGWKNLVTF